MWSKGTTDPLARLLFGKYGAHVLARPRRSLAVLTVFGVRDGRTYVSGPLASVLRVPFEEPPIARNEPVLDIASTTSSATTGSVALSFLQGFMALLGAVGARAGASLERSGSEVYTFRFEGCTLDSVTDVFDLENRLGDLEFNRERSAMRDDAKYYIAQGVHSCTSLTFDALDKRGGKVDLSADVAAVAGANASLSVDKDRTVTAKSDVPLAYGVMLNELSYDPKRKRLGLKEVQQYVHVMAHAPRVQPTTMTRVGDADSGVLVVEDEEMGPA
ncbi:MAG: hypothetical protein ABIP93_01700 [Gemmatimonadaceae bacterium]